MQFIDLKTQYKSYQAEVDGRMRAVLDHGHFIMGPEIAELHLGSIRVKQVGTVLEGRERAQRPLGQSLRLSLSRDARRV